MQRYKVVRMCVLGLGRAVLGRIMRVTFVTWHAYPDIVLAPSDGINRMLKSCFVQRWANGLIPVLSKVLRPTLQIRTIAKVIAMMAG